MNILICPACDLIQERVDLNAGESCYCACCSEELAFKSYDKIESIRALLVTSVLLIVAMNWFPLVTMEVNGSSHSVTLLEAIYNLYHQDMIFLGTLVLITTVLSPTIEISLLILIFYRFKTSLLSLHSNKILHLMHALKTWSMVEVFMLGILVSLVKLTAFSQITPRPAMVACIGLIVLLAALKRMIHTDLLWRAFQVS